MLKTNRKVQKSEINTLDLATRITLEAQITDERSQAIPFTRFQQIETDWSKFTAAKTWRRSMADFFGPLQNKVLLDIACGYSMTPVIFALAGATVHAIDVASKTIATVQQFAEYKGVSDRVTARVCPAERLPYADASIDLVFGGAALHHLQLDQAAAEIARVLKPGGKGVFQEPLGHNRVLEFARDYLPYKDKHPVKGTDRPLRVHDIERFGQYFTTYRYEGFDLFGMLAKPLRLKRGTGLHKQLHSFDDWLFSQRPALQRYARYALIYVTK